MRYLFILILVLAWPAAAHAEPITLTTLAIISGISALASAGGAGLSMMGASKDARANRSMQQKFHADELAEAEKNRAFNAQQFAFEKQRYQDQKPLSALQMISGMNDMAEKRSRSGNYLESIRLLGGR